MDERIRISGALGNQVRNSRWSLLDFVYMFSDGETELTPTEREVCTVMYQRTQFSVRYTLRVHIRSIGESLKVKFVVTAVWCHNEILLRMRHGFYPGHVHHSFPAARPQRAHLEVVPRLSNGGSLRTDLVDGGLTCRA